MSEETITLAKQDFDSLMERVVKLERGIRTTTPKRVNERVATLRFIDGKYPVSRVGLVKIQDYGLPTQHNTIDIYYVDDKGKEVKKVFNYLNFLNTPDEVDAPRIQVSILKQEAHERKEVQEHKRPIDPSNDRYKQEPIDFTVTFVDYTLTCEILEGELKGQTITVQDNLLNM